MHLKKSGGLGGGGGKLIVWVLHFIVCYVACFISVYFHFLSISFNHIVAFIFICGGGGGIPSGTISPQAEVSTPVIVIKTK